MSPDQGNDVEKIVEAIYIVMYYISHVNDIGTKSCESDQRKIFHEICRSFGDNEAWRLITKISPRTLRKIFP